MAPGCDDPAYEDVLRTRLQDVAGADVEVLIEGVSNGPFTLEHRYYQALLIRELVHRAYSLRDSVDAIVMGSALDLGLSEARELMEIPIVGVGEAALHVAALLGHKFSVLTGLRSLVPKVEALVRGHGLLDRLASVRATSLTVQELRTMTEDTLGKVNESIRAAVEDDGAEVIVAACGSLGEAFSVLRDQWPVPLLDSRLVAFKVAVFLADLYRRGICYTSKVGLYATPRVLPEELQRMK